MIDAVLGIPDAGAGGITVTSSQHLPADLAGAGSSAFDGDPDDGVEHRVRRAGGAVARRRARPRRSPSTTSTCRSWPTGSTRCRRSCASTPAASRAPSTFPAIADGAVGATPVSVPVPFAPLTGSDVRVTVTGVREVDTIDYHERVPTAMPVAIAEVGMPGVQRARAAGGVAGACRTDLLAVDGQPVGVQLTGTTAAAAAGLPRRPGAVPGDRVPTPALDLDRGDHVVRSTAGTSTGIDVDGLVLGSDAEWRADGARHAGRAADVGDAARGERRRRPRR